MNHNLSLNYYNTRGFTLVELMVTMTLGIILSFSGVVVYSTMISQIDFQRNERMLAQKARVILDDLANMTNHLAMTYCNDKVDHNHKFFVHTAGSSFDKLRFSYTLSNNGPNFQSQVGGEFNPAILPAGSKLMGSPVKYSSTCGLSAVDFYIRTRDYTFTPNASAPYGYATENFGKFPIAYITTESLQAFKLEYGLAATADEPNVAEYYDSTNKGEMNDDQRARLRSLKFTVSLAGRDGKSTITLSRVANVPSLQLQTP